MSDTEEMLTVAEAARRMGVLERQARRWAAKLADSDRTIDRTVTGRSVTLVRLSALRKIRERSARSNQVEEDRPDSDRSEDRTNDRTTDRTNDRTENLSLATMATAYERVIQEQAARIVDLQTALEHERQQSRRQSEALAESLNGLAREQMLRALPAPATQADETLKTPAEGTQQPPDVSKVAQGMETGTEAATEPKSAGSWWARIWARVKD